MVRGEGHGAWHLARVMVKLAMVTGWKSSILGYMSRGERVPEVITTVWNRSNTGLGEVSMLAGEVIR